MGDGITHGAARVEVPVGWAVYENEDIGSVYEEASREFHSVLTPVTGIVREVLIEESVWIGELFRAQVVPVGAVVARIERQDSAVVGYLQGIQNVVAAINHVNNNIGLHLLGELKKTRTELETLNKNLEGLGGLSNAFAHIFMAVIAGAVIIALAIWFS